MKSNTIRLIAVTIMSATFTATAWAGDPVQRSIEGLTPITTASGLKYYDIKVGDGPVPKPGSMVKADYSGWLTDGKLFDSSVKRGAPITFNTSSGMIKGWLEGVATMKVGGIRRLEIPSDLAYGPRGAPPVVPANADLVFEIELVSIEKEPAAAKTPVAAATPKPQAEDPVQRSIEGLTPVTADSGLKYYDIKVGDGEEPASGAKVNVHYSGWDTSGKLFDSSVKRGSPFSFNTDRGVIKGWIEGVKGMKVGGIRRLEIPADMAYGKNDLIFEVEMLGVEAPGSGSPAAPPKKEAPKKEEPKKDEKPDPVQSSIEGLTPVTTESGLKYYVLKEGDGEIPRSGADVKAHYSGWLTDGTLFDSSVKRDQPFAFRTNGGVIDGWLEAVSTMKVGERRRLEIPPEIGYGERDAGKIPPNSTLIFEMELLSIEKQGPEKSSLEGLKEIKTDSGLKYWVIKEGTGEPAGPDGRVKMHGTAWLENGRLVGSTRDRGMALTSPVSKLLKGWSEAAADMKLGEIRCLELPPALGYGEEGNRAVPPNSTLILEVEMNEILPVVKQVSTNGLEAVTLDSGTKYWDLKVGDGATVQANSECVTQYVGWLTDGTMFDNSAEKGEPYTFKMDSRQIIEGWKEGLGGMKVGGKRRLRIPPEKAYGNRARGQLIPANSTLIFEIELLEIKTP
jgi:FKBP-type peptidyl-prolyl cis-trans isomerase